MGYSRYNDTVFRDYSIRMLKASDGTRLDVRDTFNYSKENKAYNPINIKIRESVDSEANPDSMPIIIGVDFTASMGFVAHEMVNEYVPALMTSLIDGAVKDPHILAMAIRDYKSSPSTPLQVSQFEADHKVIEQMQDFYNPSSGGGGNGEESYALAWAFAALKTKIDSYDKRGKKGYIFTIGDDGPQTGNLTDSDMERLIGAGEGMSVEDIYKLANEKYNIFHIHLSRGGTEAFYKWQKVLGKRAISLDDYTKVPELIKACIAISEGGNTEYMELNHSVEKALGLR